MFSFISSAWNFIVGIAPTVLEAVCKIVNSGAEVLKTGVGS